MADVDVEAEVEGGGAIVVMLGILTMKLCAQHNTELLSRFLVACTTQKSVFLSLAASIGEGRQKVWRTKRAKL